MKSFARLVLLLLIVTGALPATVAAQSLAVGTPGLEDAYRRAQLTGRIDSSLSFIARPLYPVRSLISADIYDPDSTLKNSRWAKSDGMATFAGTHGFVRLLPATVQTQFSSYGPLSLNDGPMLPAKGFQTLLSTGLYASLGPLSIQFQPEYLLAQNIAYEGFPQDFPNIPWWAYYKIFNSIDLPESFGDRPVRKAFWGQSSVRLTVGPVSLGLSNENLWWGPGIRNSLLMTNSAPGFKHLTLNTVRPIRTPIGSFEGQLVAGRLDSSGFKPPLLLRDNLGNQVYVPKPNDWRYLNGFVLSYQPKWAPGLFLGATRAIQTYHNYLDNRLGSYLPAIIPVSENDTLNQPDVENDSIGRREQLGSLFIRWLWLKEQGEIYFEYGKENHTVNFRDLLSAPEITRAYIAGLRKLFPLKRHPGNFIQFQVELTQLEATKNRNRSPYFTWYAHPGIVHGYTHTGQILGAGIGPGSSMQTINVSWIKGLKVLGLQVERYAHNNDLHYLAGFIAQQHWTDLIVTLAGTWDYKNLLLTCNLDGISSINYQWVYDPPGTNPALWAHGEIRYSFQARLAVMWRF